MRPNPRNLQENGEASAEARAELECALDISYGPTLLEKLDVFPAPQKGGPVLVFHHGGAWTRSSKDHCSYVAPPVVAAGASVVVLGFGLAPKVRR
jgi:arylformamidase